MRPTRRGWAVAALVGFCLAMAARYGDRSLNALVAPLVVVLGAALASVYRAKKPQVRREPVDPGFVGDVREVGLSFDVGSPTAAVVRDELGDGLRSTTLPFETTIPPDETVTYDVALESRGEQRVGPATVGVRDVMGLAETQFSYRRDESVLVYPTVYDLRGGTRRSLELLADAARQHERDEFSHLREYERGDALRDVHWKKTASRPDDEPVVKEFVAGDDVRTVEIVAEAAPDCADEMASAAASLATHLLERGVAVGVTVPNDRCVPETGRSQHVAILAALARAGTGEVTGERGVDGDVYVTATDDATTVAAAGDEIPFDRFRGAGVRNVVVGDAGVGETLLAGSRSATGVVS